MLARAQGGDGEAFAALVRHYDAGLRALAFHLLGDRELMDDALQETYLKAFRALPGFRGESALGTWLYRITYNVCLDELRRRGHRERLLPLPTGEAAEARATLPDAGERVARATALRAALMELPGDERATVWLVDGEGYDYRAAAEVLGVPEGTVASRLSRARASLREALGEIAHGGGSS